MPFQKYMRRILYIDSLIRIKATGPVSQLSKKLQLSERTTLEHIKTMKELGCPIKYCRKRNSYCYDTVGKIVISFFDMQRTEENLGGGVIHTL